jgi:hypothetical protein
VPPPVLLGARKRFTVCDCREASATTRFAGAVICSSALASRSAISRRENASKMRLYARPNRRYPKGQSPQSLMLLG